MAMFGSDSLYLRAGATKGALSRSATRLSLAALVFGAAHGPAAAQWVTPPVEAERVEYRLFESAAAGATVSYHIYTPPHYDREPTRRFPVLFWLHGSGGATASVAPISGWFHSLIEAEAIPPMIVVIPNGMSYRMWCDSLDGTFPMESVVIEDLLPEVDASFRTIAAREARIIEGFSMGGQGSARLGLRRPDLFAGVSILGAGPLQLDFLDAPEGGSMSWELRLQIYEAVWGSDPAYYLEQHPRTIAVENAEAITASGLTIRQAVGDLDHLLQMNLDFAEHLRELGVSHEFLVLPGVSHSTSALFAAMGSSNWSFYRELFKGFAPNMYFAQFADGDGFSSQIVLVNLDPARAASAGVRIRKSDGEPMTVNLGGVPAVGERTVDIPANGTVILETDGTGELQVGSVTVVSDTNLSGVVLFSSPLGYAGVGASRPLSANCSGGISEVVLNMARKGIARDPSPRKAAEGIARDLSPPGRRDRAGPVAAVPPRGYQRAAARRRGPARPRRCSAGRNGRPAPSDRTFGFAGRCNVRRTER